VEEPYAVGASDVELTPEAEPLRRSAGARAFAAPADGGEARLREALSLASRDVVERIAWEVVPQLAETIIREQLERLISAREQNR
jgi:hypothetical protein